MFYSLMMIPLPDFLRSVRRFAFTLTELLVVIAILAILTVLLIPGINTMMAKAQGAKCMSNLRQIGSAVAAYSGENHGAFPRGGWTDSGSIPLEPPSIDGVGWLADIYPYVGENRAVFVCPTGKNTSPTGLSSWLRMPGGKVGDPKYPFHYAYNAHLNSIRRNLRDSPVPGTVDRVAAVKNLSGLPVMIDIVFQNNFAGEYPVFESPPPVGNGRVFADRHGKTGNVLWGDGRVTPMTFGQWVGAPAERVSVATGWKGYHFCTGNY